ncbi:MAG: caspase family protein [Tenuifilaceae bacterium]
MSKRNGLIFSVLAVILLYVIPARAQEFTNITTKQLGEKINIEYAITGEKLGQLFTITPYYSLDAGKTFLPIKSVVGNVGTNVPGGRNLIIIWDVLKDLKELEGDVMFKLTADTKQTVPTEDEVGKMNFRIESLHHSEKGKIELLLTITNNGPTRNLKMVNGKITLTDFKKQKYDAQKGTLGDVQGNERYSVPERKVKNGETVKAAFTFERIPDDLSRAMKLEIGIEQLTIDEGLGLGDLKIGKAKFQDLPVTSVKTTGMTVVVAKKIEGATSPTNYVVKKVEIADKVPPTITITTPSNVPLVGKEATRGRPYAQSSMGMDDKRLRSLSTGEEFATTEKTITVKGLAKDESGIYEVVINGQEATITPDGSFEAAVMLSVGKNEIAIRATDIRQNSVEKKFFVMRKQTQGTVAKGETEELDLIFEKKAPKYYAIIFGANDYVDDQVTDLDAPISDAQKLYDVLTTKYTFNAQDVRFIKNPTREQMINEFDILTRKSQKNDNILVFYAGHGFWDKDTDFGYWLPVDSKSTTTANWFANSQIKDYVAAIKSKHTLLITDACFGGSIFRNRKTFEETTAKNKLYDNPSRQAMTSGALTVVPDKSLFLEYLVKRLQENTKDYLSAEELFSSFKNEVMNGSPVTPMFGDIKDTGDEGGDFLFVKK